MISDEDIEVFLAHHGVKGMKWGERRTARLTRKADRAEKLSNDYKKRAANPNSLITDHDAKRAQKRAERLRRAAEGKRTPADIARTVALGAAAAGTLFLLFGPAIKVNNLPKTATPSVADVIRKTRDEQMSSLTRTFKEGHMDKAQYEKFSKAMGDRYDRKIADALKGGK